MDYRAKNRKLEKGKNHASACMGDGLEETRMWGTVF